MNNTKLCLFCKHFAIIMADSGFSEYTPGNDFDMLCVKNIWKFDSWSITTEEYRKLMKTAEQCDYFKLDNKLTNV